MISYSFMWVDSSLPFDCRVTGARLPLEQILSLLSVNSYDGVEVLIGDPFCFPVGEILKQTKKYGLQLSQVCTGEFQGTFGLTLNHPDQEHRDRALRWAEKTIEIAAECRSSMNIGRFRGSVTVEGKSASENRMAESFEIIGRKARREGVSLLIEPLKSEVCGTLTTLNETADFLTKISVSSIGWMLDTDHTSANEYADASCRLPQPEYVHFSDTHHLPLGKGSIDFSAYSALLNANAYNGYVGVEVFSDKPHDAIIKESMKFIQTMCM